MTASTIVRLMKIAHERLTTKVPFHVYVHAGIRVLLAAECRELCERNGVSLDVGSAEITHVHGMEIHTLPDNILRPGIVGFCTELPL